MRQRALAWAVVGYAAALLGCGGATIDVGSLQYDGGPSDVVGADAATAPEESGPPGIDATLPAIDATPLSDDACAIGDIGWIVFDSNRDGAIRDIFAIRSDGTGLTRLTNGPGSAIEPAFAPDGVHLAYASNVSGVSQIYVLNVQTRETKQLTNRPEGANQPAWSPDGALLAFHTGTYFIGAIHTIHADGTGDLSVMPPGGDDPVECSCNYGYPTFTPDGLFLLAAGLGAIQEVRLDGSDDVDLLLGDLGSMSVYPDGQTFAYSAECGVATTVLDAPQSCARIVAQAPAEHPSFGPNGLIVFDTGLNNDFNVNEAGVPANPGNPAQVEIASADCAYAFNVTRSSADDRNPSWAPSTFGSVQGVQGP